MGIPFLLLSCFLSVYFRDPAIRPRRAGGKSFLHDVSKFKYYLHPERETHIGRIPAALTKETAFAGPRARGLGLVTGPPSKGPPSTGREVRAPVSGFSHSALHLEKPSVPLHGDLLCSFSSL